MTVSFSTHRPAMQAHRFGGFFSIKIDKDQANALLKDFVANLENYKYPSTYDVELDSEDGRSIVKGEFKFIPKQADQGNVEYVQYTFNPSILTQYGQVHGAETLKIKLRHQRKPYHYEDYFMDMSYKPKMTLMQTVLTSLVNSNQAKEHANKNEISQEVLQAIKARIQF